MVVGSNPYGNTRFRKANADKYDGINAYLKYAVRSGVGAWRCETVDDGAGVSAYTSIAIDKAGKPLISYYDWNLDDLKYAVKTNESWNLSVIDSDGDVGRYTSLVITH